MKKRIKNKASLKRRVANLEGLVRTGVALATNLLNFHTECTKQAHAKFNERLAKLESPAPSTEQCDTRDTSLTWKATGEE